MKKFLFFTLISGFFCTQVRAQSPVIKDSLARMLSEGRNVSVLSWAKYMDPDTLDASSLFYIGMAAYLEEADNLAEEYFTLAVSKDPYFSAPYHYLSILSEENGNISKAFTLEKNALRLEPDDPLYLEHLADLYDLSGFPDSASVLYARIIENGANPDASVFMKLAALYAQRGATEKALQYFYQCIYTANDASGYYNDCLYNAGYLEYEQGNYRESMILLETLLDRDSSDYYAWELLVRSAMRSDQMQVANLYRKKLYSAHQEGKLPAGLSMKFLLDEYSTENGQVQIYEYFADPTENEGIKYKIVFNGNDSTQRQFFLVQNSYALRKGKSYVLIELSDEGNLIYPDALFSARISYARLQNILEKAIEGKLKSN